MDALLHVGVEHPNALWLVATAIVSFAAGMGALAYARLRRPRADADSASD